LTGNLSYDVPVTDHRERPAPEEPSVLRAARQAAGLSQEELAERSGLSVRNISNIERGRVTRPRRSSLDALADALTLARTSGAC
jgi:predicted transcriptional regulator